METSRWLRAPASLQSASVIDGAAPVGDALVVLPSKDAAEALLQQRGLAAKYRDAAVDVEEAAVLHQIGEWISLPWPPAICGFDEAVTNISNVSGPDGRELCRDHLFKPGGCQREICKFSHAVGPLYGALAKPAPSERLLLLRAINASSLDTLLALVDDQEHQYQGSTSAVMGVEETCDVVTAASVAGENGDVRSSCVERTEHERTQHETAQGASASIEVLEGEEGEEGGATACVGNLIRVVSCGIGAVTPADVALAAEFPGCEIWVFAPRLVVAGSPPVEAVGEHEHEQEQEQEAEGVSDRADIAGLRGQGARGLNVRAEGGGASQAFIYEVRELARKQQVRVRMFELLPQMAEELEQLRTSQ
jgi:hypothetical protein